ncbi:MAG: hypothetical protein HQ483_12785 [Rhodospirillales bacterium]|nr:hypothetical protein [Rhodospirillales bacterium]
MRYSVVYEGDNRRWAVIDCLTSDQPFSYYRTEWDALSRARFEERRWRTHQTPCPRLN